MHPCDDKLEMKKMTERNKQKRENGSGNSKQLTKKIKTKRDKPLRRLYLRKIANEIKKAKDYKLCVKMWRKAGNYDNIIQ